MPENGKKIKINNKIKKIQLKMSIFLFVVRLDCETFLKVLRNHSYIKKTYFIFEFIYVVSLHFCIYFFNMKWNGYPSEFLYHACFIVRATKIVTTEHLKEIYKIVKWKTIVQWHAALVQITETFQRVGLDALIKNSQPCSLWLHFLFVS